MLTKELNGENVVCLSVWMVMMSSGYIICIVDIVMEKRSICSNLSVWLVMMLSSCYIICIVGIVRCSRP